MAKPNISLDELLKESKALVSNLKTKVCRRCKEEKRLVQSGFCKECYLQVGKEREEKRKDKKIEDAKGYVRVYDDDGKLVLEHRYLMEKQIGRKLKKEEVVLHLDGDKSNNDLSNLAIGFKNGTPLIHLQCTNCGTKGKFTYQPEL